jgi:hypothetical protein
MKILLIYESQAAFRWLRDSHSICQMVRRQAGLAKLRIWCNANKPKDLSHN